MPQKSLFLLCFILLVTATSYAQAGKRGVCSISATAAKMNVLYIGVNNPIEIKLSVGDSLEVSINKGTIERANNKGYYNVRVSEVGSAIVTVIIHNEGNRQVDFPFRVKRIPDPVAALGAKFTRSDTIGTGLFKAQLGIAMLLSNFDFDANCKTLGFKITLIGGSDFHDKGFVNSVYNTGARFGPEATEIISQGEPGDIFIFSDITAECPEDKTPRKLNGLVFFLDDRE